MNSPILYRRRLIPDECIPLKDDIILECTSERIVTSWKAQIGRASCRERVFGLV